MQKKNNINQQKNRCFFITDCEMSFKNLIHAWKGVCWIIIIGKFSTRWLTSQNIYLSDRISHIIISSYQRISNIRISFLTLFNLSNHFRNLYKIHLSSCYRNFIFTLRNIDFADSVVEFFCQLVEGRMDIE